VTPAPTLAATESPVAALSPTDEAALTIGVGGSAVQAATATPPPTETASAVVAASPEAAIPTPAAAASPVPAAQPAAVATPAAATAPATAGTATPAAALEQPPAVGADAAPAQEIVVGPLRLAITAALREESLPRYGLPPSTGEWVLLTLEAANEGESAATMPMSDFRLFDRGPGAVVDLDAGVGVIASLAGLDPARAPGDAIEVAPGDTTDVLLLYLLPPGSSDDLTLIVGQTSIDLAPSLALGEAAAATAPELVQGTVRGVVDGGRITVDVDGVERTVQYLGMQAPTGAACFAPEATAANAALVEGQQVWLEREATDRGDDDALLRDVWISDADGNRVLVAARLVEAGAATPLPAAPDTRYEAWLEAAAALARTNGAGLWSACPDAPASANVSARETLQLAFLSDDWNEYRRLGAR
jgi:endonuclease YncB( thermonuclease family)